jgi:hypothetical protein
VTWEDEPTRDAPAWSWEGAAERAMGRDDRQQADLGRTPDNEPTDDTEGED